MIGENIRAVRKTVGMTQEDLATAIGVKRSVISKYENGSIVPSLDQLNKIAAAFEISVLAITDPVKYSRDQAKDFEIIPSLLPNEYTLLDAFAQLNNEGQDVAIDRVKELTEIERYRKPADQDPK